MSTSDALAQSAGKQACIDAHSQSQRLRHAGKLLAARGQLRVCVSDKCPPMVNQDCATWSNELENEIPTVVVAASDELGHDVIAAHVTVDGVDLASALDGRPVEVDPGPHKFVVTLPDGHQAEAEAVIHAGEKARVLHLDVKSSGSASPLAPVPSPSGAGLQTESRVPVAGLAVGGVGVASLIVFTVLGIDGYSREESLSSSCNHSCSPSSVQSVKTEYNAADVALGIGLAFVATGTVMTLVKVLSHHSETPSALRGPLGTIRF